MSNSELGLIPDKRKEINLFSKNVQNSSGSRPIIYSGFTRNVPLRVSNSGVKLTAQFHLVPMGNE
jgi:hypothetical protein